MGGYTPIKHTIGIVKELILFTQQCSISFYYFILIAQDKNVSFRIILLYLVSLHSNVFSFLFFFSFLQTGNVSQDTTLNPQDDHLLNHERSPV